MVPNAMRRRGSWRIASDLPASFRYAAQGLGYAFLTQRNFRIHVVTGLVVFGLATWLLCLLYTSPSPRDQLTSRMPSSA